MFAISHLRVSDCVHPKRRRQPSSSPLRQQKLYRRWCAPEMRDETKKTKFPTHHWARTGFLTSFDSLLCSKRERARPGRAHLTHQPDLLSRWSRHWRSLPPLFLPHSNQHAVPRSSPPSSSSSYSPASHHHYQPTTIVHPRATHRTPPPNSIPPKTHTPLLIIDHHSPIPRAGRKITHRCCQTTPNVKEPKKKKRELRSKLAHDRNKKNNDRA